MKKNVLKQYVAEHITAAGGNVAEGLSSFRQQIAEGISGEEKLSLQDISLGDLFEAMCDRDGMIDRHSASDVAEAMTAAMFPTVVGQLIHPVIIKAYEPLANTVLPLVFETNSSRPSESIVGFGSTDQLTEVRESQPYEEAQPTERKCTIKNHKFGKIISVTMEMVMFDQTGEALRVAAGIGNKAGTHLHEFIVNKVCDYACTATGEAANKSLVVDGTSRTVYADTHASWDIQVNDNNQATALSDAGLTTALALLAAQKDDKGDPIVIFPKTLLVPAALHVVAKKLIGSPDQYDTGNRSINPFYNAYSIIMSPFIDATSATAWFVGDFQAQCVLQWVYKMRTETLRDASQVSFNNDIVFQAKAGYYAGVGLTDYRFVVKGNA